MDGRTDGGAAGAAQAFLLCIWWLVIGTPGVRQRDCRPRRRTASRSHRQPARRGTAGGVPKHRPSAPGAVGAPLPTTVAVTAVGFAWQRPGPAELPAHRRPDRQDRRLRALALQVQSKAGLGEEGGRGGCALGPRKHACGHAHADTRCTEPRTPPRTHLPSPAVPGQPPGLCWGGGFCPADHPARGLSVPQDQAAPPALSPPRPAAPPEHEVGGVAPPRRPGPPPSRVQRSRGSPVLPGLVGTCPPASARSLQAAACTLAWGLSVRPACSEGGGEEAVGLEGGVRTGRWGEREEGCAERQKGEVGTGGWGWGLGRRKQSMCLGGIGDLGCSGGVAGGGQGAAGPGSALAVVWPVPYV